MPEQIDFPLDYQPVMEPTTRVRIGGEEFRLTAVRAVLAPFVAGSYPDHRTQVRITDARLARVLRLYGVVCPEGVDDYGMGTNCVEFMQQLMAIPLTAGSDGVEA
jgi:hypothetical protein